MESSAVSSGDRIPFRPHAMGVPPWATSNLMTTCPAPFRRHRPSGEAFGPIPSSTTVPGVTGIR